jgi:hypothetical protein
MKTVEHRWRISLAAAFLTTGWTAMTPAAELSNAAATPTARPTTTAVAKPSKPVPTRMELRKPASNSFRHQFVSGGPILLILGVAY